VLGPAATQRLIDLRRGAKDQVRALSPAGRANLRDLVGYENRHEGETCVIIGNGPSLNQTDLALLRGVPTFGLNRIYLKFPELGFDTTYHVVVNKYVVEQCREDFAAISAPLFTTWVNKAALRERERDTLFLAKRPGPYFSPDLRSGIWEGATVTYVAMQIAYFMGFQRVVLVGVDHRFSTAGPAHQLVQSTGADSNHFDPNYFGPGFNWQLPDLETSEIAYGLAGEAFAARGGSIVDATVDGALQVFPKVDLADALA
jgi:hypothetical protein